MNHPTARRIRRSAALLLLVSMLAGCAGARPLTAPAPPTAAGDLHPNAAEANARFSFRLFQALRKERPTENLFFSPVSLSLALSMTANGARGETLAAMLKGLSMDGWSLEEVNRSAAAMSALANPDPQVQLSVANSVWYKRGLTVKPGFEQAMKTYYQAGLEPADFGRPGAENAINRWVARATRDRIPTCRTRASSRPTFSPASPPSGGSSGWGGLRRRTAPWSSPG